MRAEPDLATAGQLTDAAARRILARAAEIDVQRGAEASLAELRSAARDAGISAEAFDAAVAEWQEGARPPVPGAAGAVPAAPVRQGARRWYRRGLFWTALVAALLGLGFLRMAVPAPIERSVPAAGVPLDVAPAQPAAEAAPARPAAEAAPARAAR